MRALLLALAFALLGASPAQATLFEISGRTDGSIPSTKHPRPATDVRMQAQLLAALPDGQLAIVTGWITSLVGIDANGTARPLKGTKHLLEDPADVVAAPGGGVLVSNEEVVQHVAPDGKRTTRVHRTCQGSVCATPWGLAARPDGSLLYADTFNDRVALVAPDGTTATVLGDPVHWPFALGLLPDGGFMVAEGKPGHGRVDVGLHVWRVAPDGTASVVAGGSTGARLQACGGMAASPLDLDLRHMVDATTAPDGTIYLADKTAGLLALNPDGTWRVVACAPSTPAREIGALRPAGLEPGALVGIGVRHLTVDEHGTLYVADDHGRVYADLPPDAERLAVALTPATLAGRMAAVTLTRSADVRIELNGRRVAHRSLPSGVSEVALPRLPGGVSTLVVEARSGAAVATHRLRVLRRLDLRVGRRLLRRELRAVSRFGAAPRLRGCRGSSSAVRCRRPDASIRRRDDGVLEVRRGQRLWLAAP